MKSTEPTGLLNRGDGQVKPPIVQNPLLTLYFRGSRLVLSVVSQVDEIPPTAWQSYIGQALLSLLPMYSAPFRGVCLLP